LVPVFVQKYQVGPHVFLVSIWSQFVKIDASWYFLLNFLKRINDFLSKVKLLIRIVLLV